MQQELVKKNGYERMLKLAQELKKANIKFRWTIFTDLNLYGKKPFDLEEVVYMKPSHDFMDYIVEADYGVQLSDTEGYSYFMNECLQYGTPVICTNFPSAYESVEEGKSGYILDMDLKNLDMNKIVNNIPKDFKYEEKGREEDWIKLLNKKIERKNKEMYKIIAKQNYKDTRPELIEEYQNKDKEIEYNLDGSLAIKEGDIYIVNDAERAKQIEESGLATVIEVRQEKEETKKDTTEVKKPTRRTRKKKEE